MTSYKRTRFPGTKAGALTVFLLGDYRLSSLLRNISITVSRHFFGYVIYGQNHLVNEGSQSPWPGKTAVSPSSFAAAKGEEKRWFAQATVSQADVLGDSFVAEAFLPTEGAQSYFTLLYFDLHSG